MRNEKVNNRLRVMLLVIIVICSVSLLLLVFNPGILDRKSNVSQSKLDDNYKIIYSANGFLSASSVDSSQFVINGDDDACGPYILNTTTNKYLSISLYDGDTYKPVGYIELGDDLKYYAVWESKNIQFLCIKSHDRWYFFDENGNMIKPTDAVVDVVENNEAETNKINDSTEEQKSEEDILKKANNISNFVYKDLKLYNEFHIGVTNDNELVLYKTGNDSDKDKMYFKTRVYTIPGYYADYNNANSGNIRIRVDKYDNKTSKVYSQTWYEINGTTGALISSQEYIDSSLFTYKDSKIYNEFHIGVTDNNELMLYKLEDNSSKAKIYYKTKVYTSPGYYADYNNANSGNIRIRVDKYDNKTSKVYSQMWHEINGTTGALISSQEYIDSSLFTYKDSKIYNEFHIGVTDNNELMLYKLEDNSSKAKIYYKTKVYTSPGYYADYNNANSGNIRIRVDKYDNKTSKVYSQIWYEINGTTGALISSQEYIDSSLFTYKDSKIYNEFHIGVTDNNELMLYKLEDNSSKAKIYYKTKVYTSPGYYADYNNANSGNIRIRVDKYDNKTSKVYSQIWYEINGITGKLNSMQEYIY